MGFGAQDGQGHSGAAKEELQRRDLRSRRVPQSNTEQRALRWLRPPHFFGGELYLSPYSRFYANAFSKNAGHSDPALDSAAMIADLESVAADGLHESDRFNTSLH